jgi:transaldolase
MDITRISKGVQAHLCAVLEPAHIMRNFAGNLRQTGLYAALAAPFTVKTMPEATLQAFAGHGVIGGTVLAPGDALLAEFAAAGIDREALGAQLLGEGTEAFVKSWNDLLDCIASRSHTLIGA